MLHASKVNAITRLIMGLFATKKGNVTRLNHKDLYFKQYYLPENLCKGVDMIARIEQTSKIRAVAKLVEMGISSYMHQKIALQVELDNEARARNEKAKRSRFAFILRKIARQNGYDISKFI
jgi:hypothetical protein